MRTHAAALFLAVCLTACHPSQRVQIVHFSDYHSHAVPFFSEHQANQAGIARALAYVKQLKAKDPNLMVLSGGDMVNAGAPAWSDKYTKDCTEWKWWNGLVTAMAFGNHDVDYGWDTFAACQKQGTYPVLSGNLIDNRGNLLLSTDGKPYLVHKLGEIRIGLFALSGPDFPRLVKAANLPPGASFADSITVAKSIVTTLREQEQVQAVIFFGHQDRETDFAMARQVPGIDLILGTHSHYKGELQRIPDTQTYFISPFQYLNYLSQVELLFDDGKLSAITGQLQKMSADLPEDKEVAAAVADMQTQLEADPMYAPRFAVIGQAAVELDFTNIDRNESILGNFAMDILRSATPAHAAFSSASSFRASIPPGNIRLEDYLMAIPYPNKVLALTLTGAQVQALLDVSLKKRASDNFAVTSGLRYTIAGGNLEKIQIVKDALAQTPEYETLLPEKTYTVMSTNFMVDVADGYSSIFKQAKSNVDTKRIVNDVLIDFIRKNSPVSAKLDGRIAE